MQINVNSRPGRPGVVSSEIQERIKCRSRVCVQKRFPQSRLADFTNGQMLSLVPGITETSFPVPRLEIIAKFPHLAAHTNIEQIIVISELFVSRTGVVNAAKLNSGSYRKTASIGKKTGDGRIGDREWIKRILNWHTEGARTKRPIGSWDLEWIGNNRHRCERRIEK